MRPRWGGRCALFSAVVVLFVGPGLLAGCSDDDGASVDAGADAFTVDATPDASPLPYPVDELQLTWVPCSLYEGAHDGLAQCASAAMPVDWEAPLGPKRYVVAKRLLSSASGGGEAQYWLLNGGPGLSALDQLHPGCLQRRLGGDGYPDPDDER